MSPFESAARAAKAAKLIEALDLETRQIVLECFRRRVRASVDAQIAAAMAGALTRAS